MTSRRKGHDNERSIRRLFEAAGYNAVRCDQTSEHHKEADVYVSPRYVTRSTTIALPALRIECKNDKTLPGKRVLAAYDQALRVVRTGEIAVVMFKIPGVAAGHLCMVEIQDLLRMHSAYTYDPTEPPRVATSNTSERK